MKIRLNYIILILLVLSYTNIYAQSNSSNFEEIDAHALAAPEQVSTNTSSLAKYLSQVATTDLEKVRGIYTWMTHHIRYDVETYLNWGVGHTVMVDDTKAERKRIMQETLKNRLGVCQGYSELFDALCKKMGIKSYIIVGYSKSYGTHNIVKEIVEPDHTWNAVWIDEQWHLIDPTWGSGFINQSLTFTPSPDNRFFLTAPDKLIYTHLPADPMWQLLDCPISFDTFKQDSSSIQLAAQKEKVCYVFQDSIRRFLQLPSKEQELVTAQHAYDFNPTNTLLIGMAHFNYANEQARQLVENKSLKGKALDDHFHKVVRHRKKAINYLGDSRIELVEALGMDEFNYAVALLKPINDLKSSTKQLQLMDRADKIFAIAESHLAQSVSPEGKDALNACQQNRALIKKNRGIVKKNIEIEKYNEAIRKKNK